MEEVGKSITEVSAKVKEILDFKSKFDSFIEEELDPGETEALKILNDREDYYFCTCDKAAIKVIALIGKREQGLSFEMLLKFSGITKRLEIRQTEKYFPEVLG